jgi:hypothetical protein
MRPLAHLSAVLLCAAGVVASGACADLTNLAGGAGPRDDGGPSGGDAALTLAITPASLDFGVAGCGTPVPPQTVNLENTGGAAIAYEASLPEASGFALGGQQITTTSGMVPPGGRTAIAINVAALRTLGLLATKLTLKIGDELREVPITVTGLGAKLDVDKQIVDYGDVYYTAGASADVAIQNPGTEDITITGLTNLGTDFLVDKTTALPRVVPKGGTAKLRLDFLAGTAGALLMNDITLDTDAKPLCGEKPTLSLRARRVSTLVTISPGTVDFGKQPCGALPAPQLVTIKNYGPSSAKVTTASQAGSRFVVPNGSQDVPAQDSSGPGTVTFTVKPALVTAPLGIVTENIQLGVDGMPRALVVRFEPRGAILDLTPTALNFSFMGQKRTVSVANTGNENAVTTYTSDSPAFTPGAGDTIFPGTKLDMQVGYTPPDPSGIYAGKVMTSLPAGITACAPIPSITVETK